MDRERHPLARRSFLSGLASLPLIGGSIALIGNPTKAAVPASDTLMESYVAFLAHEHRAALIEYGLRQATCDFERKNCRLGRVPMFWLPDDVCARGLCTHVKPSTRAAVVLSAVGLPIWRTTV